MNTARDDRDRLPEEPDGLQVVLNALRRLKKPPRIAPQHAADPDHIADVLLDRAEEFDGTRFLYLLSALQLPRFDDLAGDIYDRQFLTLASDLSTRGQPTLHDQGSSLRTPCPAHNLRRTRPPALPPNDAQGASHPVTLPCFCYFPTLSTPSRH